MTRYQLVFEADCDYDPAIFLDPIEGDRKYGEENSVLECKNIKPISYKVIVLPYED